MTFKPLLHSWHGCIPYAAVDKDGAAGAGLKPTGKSGGDCRQFEQAGQTYTRTGKSHGRTGVIYSYYLPKVQGDDEQHRHHWITAVVWLRVDTCPDDINNFFLRGVAYSTNPQGAFDTTRTDTLYVSLHDGDATHPILAYDAGVPLTPSASGVEGALNPPLVAWERLPAAAKEQLNGIRYEHTKVPVSDANFQGILDAAYSDAFYIGVAADGADCGDDDPSQDEIDPDFGEPVPSSAATATDKLR
ncbi:necrosis inducing protein [Colletotrichum filicis]|nr:necrosis inducing protein [Colletotrichum filicis]